MRVGADAGEGELGHVGLADDHGARVAKVLDYPCIRCCRRRIGEHGGPGARRLAGNVEQILDADDDSIEGAERGAVAGAAVGCIRGFPCCFRVDREECSCALA
jgi:hypothetical protein